MFVIPDDAAHAPGCNCGNAALWLVEAALLEANPSVQARKLLASQPQYTIDDDPFIQMELLLASQLTTITAPKALEAEQILRDALQPPIDADTIAKAMQKIGKLFDDPIDDSTMTQIGILINDLITKGAQDAQDAADKASQSDDDTTDDNTDDGGDGSDEGDGTDDGGDGSDDSEGDNIDNEEGDGSGDAPASDSSDTGAVITALLATGLLARGGSVEAAPEISKVFETMVNAVKYYANKQISDVVLPAVNDGIDNWAKAYLEAQDNSDGSDQTDLPSPGVLLDYVNNKLSMEPYWRTVANTSASRAYHYGAFKAADELGIDSYIIVNPMDARTSDVCQYLYGMVFDVSNAVDQSDQLADVDMEDLGDVAPFEAADMIIGKSAEELMDMGVCQPPFHYSCRSWAELLT